MCEPSNSRKCRRGGPPCRYHDWERSRQDYAALIQNAYNAKYANQITPAGQALVTANSTTYGQRTTHVTLGSGVFGQGGPHVLEFGLKFTF
jgi:hypothetical protein